MKDPIREELETDISTMRIQVVATRSLLSRYEALLDQAERKLLFKARLDAIKDSQSGSMFTSRTETEHRAPSAVE
jgi:hypothetical protein